MNKVIHLFGILILTSCTNYGQLTFITDLPKKIDESSGIVTLNHSDYWLIEDSGNKDEIYKLNQQGEILKTLEVKNAKNHDWEDLTKDEKGNIYIGDFGNNQNKRKNLSIYKIPNPDTEQGDKIKAKKIKFYYPEQKKFPPKKEEFLYDAEAFFYNNDSLYIITRNRAIPFTGVSSIYKIPAKKGEHKAEKIGSFIPCDTAPNCQITSADISPDGKTIVLLSNDKLWVYTNFKNENFSLNKSTTIHLHNNTQLESVCFLNDSTLLLTDERNHGSGGNLYSYKLE